MGFIDQGCFLLWLGLQVTVPLAVHGRLLGKSDDVSPSSGSSNINKVAEDVTNVNWDLMPKEILDIFVELNATLEDLRGAIHLMESSFAKHDEDKKPDQETETFDEADEMNATHFSYNHNKTFDMKSHPRVKSIRDNLVAHPKTRYHVETHEAYISGDLSGIEKHISAMVARLPNFETPAHLESHGRKLSAMDMCRKLVETIDHYTYYDFFVAFYRDDIDDDGVISDQTQRFTIDFKIIDIAGKVQQVKNDGFTNQQYCDDLLRAFHYNIEQAHFTTYMGQSVNNVQRGAVPTKYVSLKDMREKQYFREAGKILEDFTVCASSLQHILNPLEARLFQWGRYPVNVQAPGIGQVDADGKPDYRGGGLDINSYFHISHPNIFTVLFNPSVRPLYDASFSGNLYNGWFDVGQSMWINFFAPLSLSNTAACSNVISSRLGVDHMHNNIFNGATKQGGATGRTFGGGNILKFGASNVIEMTCKWGSYFNDGKQDGWSHGHFCHVFMDSELVCSNMQVGFGNRPEGCPLGPNMCEHGQRLRFSRLPHAFTAAPDYDHLTALTIGDEPKDSGGTLCRLAEIAETKKVEGESKMWEPQEDLKNWQEAFDFCEAQGQTLGTRNDYCLNGQHPTFPVKEGDQWAPISDLPNGWVQVGKAHGTCAFHNALYGPPTWGMDDEKQTCENNYVLCVPKVKPSEVMPGYCCLDQPSDLSRDARWGFPYQCSEPCAVLAPVLSGFSAGACRVYSGTFCEYPRSCDPILKAVDDLKIRVDPERDDGGNEALFQYLEAAPEVLDDKNAYQCGEFREYFGFDANYIIDDDIIMDIKLLEESDQFKYLNRFATFTAGGGGGGAGGDNVENLSLKLPQTPGFTEAAATDWARTNYALGQSTRYLREVFDAIDGLDCPVLPGGAGNVACSAPKNYARIVALTVLVVAEKAHDFSTFAYEETFGVSEWAMHDTIMKVEVLYDNMDILLKGLTIIDNRLRPNRRSRRDLLEIEGTNDEHELDGMMVESVEDDLFAAIQNEVVAVRDRVDGQMKEQEAELSGLANKVDVLFGMMERVLNKLDATTDAAASDAQDKKKAN